MKNEKKFIAWLCGVLTVFFCACTAGFLFLRIQPQYNLRNLYDMLAVLAAVLTVAAGGALVCVIIDLNRQIKSLPNAITRVVLLSDANSTDKVYLLSGRASALIGKGDEAYIDLENSDQSHLIGYEHVILNQIEDNWFVERVSEDYEVGLKHPGSQYVYKLKSGVCYRLCVNDILYIAGERLLIG